MSRKAFQVQVELDVQAVTCPGVWLCSNGKVSLQIYMLDSCVQTANYKPNFPILCNEKYAFYKTFFSKHQLNELQKELNDQWLFIELVQWQSCEIGNVLATFQTTLDELLYPSTISGSIAGVDLDLLMEPSKTFPGAIAPKIEVSTKTTIEETLCVCTKPSSSTVIVNPKVLLSVQGKPRENVTRTVCHSVEYSQSRKNRVSKPRKKKPPFCYRRAEDDLILRKPKYDLEGNYCSCRQSKSLDRKKFNAKKNRMKDFPVRMCSCGSGHKENFCPVCSKYSGYFERNSPSPEPKSKDASPTHTRTTLFDDNKKCHKHPKTGRCPCCRPIAYPTTDKSDSPAASDTEQEKNCCSCIVEKKSSLAEKLHAKLTKTLNSIPKAIEWVGDEYEFECECCECCSRPRSRADMYRELQKFYGNLYEKARSNALCVPDCPCLGLK